MVHRVLARLRHASAVPVVVVFSVLAVLPGVGMTPVGTQSRIQPAPGSKAVAAGGQATSGRADAPGSAWSRYMRTADPTILREMGCGDAKAVRSHRQPTDAVVVLDFGKPASAGGHEGTVMKVVGQLVGVGLGVVAGVLGAVFYLGQPRPAGAASNDRYQDNIMATGAVSVNPRIQTDGAREVISDGVNGLLVPIGDPRAMAEAVIDLLGNSERRTRLADAAQQNVRAHFTLGRMIAETEQIYRDALGEG